MSVFALPQADPHDLRDAARRLTAAGRHLERRGADLAGHGLGTVASWSGTASLLMAARSREMQRRAEHGGRELVLLAGRTSQYAEHAETTRTQVARLNERWDDAVQRARAQAQAAARATADAERAARASADRARAAGAAPGPVHVPSFDDGSDRLAQEQAELRRRYEQVMDDLEAQGYQLERAVAERDASLLVPASVAGGVAIGLAVVKLITLPPKAVALAKYGVLLGQVGRYVGLADDVVQVGLKGTPEFAKLYDALHGATRTWPVIGRAVTTAGKYFLPITAFTGALDVITGGGYEGWRDPVTRVLGGAGTAGAVTLMLAGATMGPVGLAVAGTAVVAYGLWSLGNSIYDHREQIGRFLGRARDGAMRHVSSTITQMGRDVSRAKDLVVSGGRAVAGAVDDVVNVITAPTRLLPKIGGLF